jgi:hypothetical protein
VLRSFDGVIPSVWYQAFEMAFDSSTKRYLADHPEQKNDFIPTARNDAVIQTIQRLGLDELYINGYTTHDARIPRAIKRGLLTVDDLAPLYKMPADKQKALGMGPMTRFKPDNGEPFFWRTLVEIFCRAYVAAHGPRPWSLEQKIELALDLDQIRREKLGGKWDQKRALGILKNDEPYRTKYPSPNPHVKNPKGGVGDNRIRSIIKELTGPLDNRALARVKKKHGALYLDVRKQWEAKKTRPVNLDEIRKRLELVPYNFRDPTEASPG